MQINPSKLNKGCLLIVSLVFFGCADSKRDLRTDVNRNSGDAVVNPIPPPVSNQSFKILQDFELVFAGKSVKLSKTENTVTGVGLSVAFRLNILNSKDVEIDEVLKVELTTESGVKLSLIKSKGSDLVSYKLVEPLEEGKVYQITIYDSTDSGGEENPILYSESFLTQLPDGDAKTISANQRFSCELLYEKLYCRGSIEPPKSSLIFANAIGNLPIETRSAPANLKSLAISEDGICLLNNDRHVMCASNPSEKWRIAPVSDVVELKAFGSGFCALDRKASLKCWNQADLNLTETNSVAKTTLPLGELPVMTFASGNHHGCAFGAISKEMNCWGKNNHGEFGKLKMESANESSAKVELDSKDIVKIVAGTNHSCALDKLGVVSCWGNNDHGQTRVPWMDFGGPVKNIFSGSSHTCAQIIDDTVHCWGSNQFSQLGSEQKDVTKNNFNNLGVVKDLHLGTTFTILKTNRKTLRFGLILNQSTKTAKRRW